MDNDIARVFKKIYHVTCRKKYKLVSNAPIYVGKINPVRVSVYCCEYLNIKVKQYSIRYKRAKRNLLAVEKGPQHWIQVVIWVIYFIIISTFHWFKTDVRNY